MGGKSHAALRQLGWDNAIEHIDAAMHRFEYVDGRAHAHQITRPMGRQMLDDQFGEIVTLGMIFADRETADGQAVEGQIAQECGARFSQLMMAGTLNDPE